MKNNKNLPCIITGVISLIMLIITALSSKLSVATYPFRLFEKLGIYHSDGGYGILNKDISTNGSHEFFVSLIKGLSVDGVLSFFVPFAIASLFLILALVIISRASCNSEYKWTNYLCAIIIPVVFCDFVNLAFFKNLYANSIILITMLLMCGLFLNAYKRERVGFLSLLIITLLALAYSCLGVVQATTAIIIGILITRLSKLCKGKKTKLVSIALGVVVIIQSLLFTIGYKPFDYKQNLYNAVFFGVCKYDSVTALDLHPSLDSLKETYFGMDDGEIDLEDEFYNKISYGKIIKYYITHPSNMVKVINNQAIPGFFNDYEYGFTPYSSLKKSFIPMNFLIALGVFVIIAAASVIIGRKNKGARPACEFLAGISAMWFISLVVTAIYHGNCDITANMYTFNVLFDIMLVFALVGGIRIVIKGQNEKKEEFGITHE